MTDNSNKNIECNYQLADPTRRFADRPINRPVCQIYQCLNPSLSPPPLFVLMSLPAINLSHMMTGFVKSLCWGYEGKEGRFTSVKSVL